MKTAPVHIVIHTDGGARGNPGPAACGVVIESDASGKRELVQQFGVRIGETTNNVAEYRGVVEALDAVIQLMAQGKLARPSAVSFFLDSALVVNQLNGLFKVKNATLRSLLFEIRQRESVVQTAVTYTAIPREQNAAADAMVNKALDGSR